MPLKVYHGTGADFNIFSLGHRSQDQGIDQYGTGFYFAEDPSVASGYTRGDNANVMPVYLTIKKPMTTATPAFKRPVVERLLKASPNYLDALRDFGDVDYYGERSVLASTVDAFLDYENAITQLNTIQHDFYRDHADAFIGNLYKLTGYDGVLVGDTGYGRVWVVFSPAQIKSATGNNGEYNPSNPDITRESEMGENRGPRIIHPSQKVNLIYHTTKQGVVVVARAITQELADRIIRSYVHKADSDPKYKKIKASNFEMQVLPTNESDNEDE
jgi:hypothetical protein